jgi:hypothetical protein
MQASTSFMFVGVMLVGCGAYATHDSRGITAKEYAGTTAIVFTNASPDPMCGLFMTQDGNGKYGDNWLPGQLPTGKSVEFKIKPGKYKATWNTCKQGEKPYYAGTLTHDTSFELKEATQLFAFVADTVAPTQRAAPKDFHKLVKFPGQEVGGNPQLASRPAPAVPTEPAEEQPKTSPKAAPKADMGAFIDYKAARKNMAGKHMKPKASLKRAHDVSSARVGYVEGKR